LWWLIDQHVEDFSDEDESFLNTPEFAELISYTIRNYCARAVFALKRSGSYDGENEKMIAMTAVEVELVNLYLSFVLRKCGQNSELAQLVNVAGIESKIAEEETRDGVAKDQRTKLNEIVESIDATY
jgi:hypothetical protein